MAHSKIIPMMTILILFSAAAAEAKKNHSEKIIDYGVSEYKATQSTTIPATGSIEVAFSPNEGSEHLVLKVIDSARQSISMLSYSFTSEPIVNALIRAEKRGVKVVLVADQKSNVDEDKSGRAKAALGSLKYAGVEVRTISIFPIHHDKVIIVDGSTVELGSFNYSDAAAHKNSENVFVNWSNPQLAAVYLAHFKRNYEKSATY